MKLLPLALATVAAALSLLIGSELSGSHPPEAYPVSGYAPPRVSLNTPPPSDTPVRRNAWLEQILARPLFSPDRRPIEVGVSGLPRLTGIVVAGSQRVAIFAAPANQHPIVAEAGTRVGAYEVQTIGDAGVTVVGPEGTILIRPIFDAAKPGNSPVTPMPSAPNRVQPMRPATR